MDPSEASSASVPPPGSSPSADGGPIGAARRPSEERRSAGRGRLQRTLAFGALAAGLAAVGLLALGLRDVTPGGGPLSPIAEAAQRTSELPGARFSGTGTARGAGGEMTMRFRGVYDGGSDRSSMRMEISAPQSPQLAAMMNPFRAVEDGPVMYISSPLLARGLPEGKSWFKIDLSELVSEHAEVGSVDARAMLAELEAVSGDARRVGREKVRGVATVHYAASIDPSLQAERLRDAGDDLAAELVESQGGTPTVDVWIDRRGLVRRSAMTMPLTLPGGPGAAMSMTTELYDFGIEPRIEVPPEAASFDATELSRRGLEQALGRP